DGRGARCRDAEHNTSAVWVEHAECCAKCAAPNRIEDQPERAMRLGSGQFTIDDDALTAPFGHRRTVFIASDMSPYEGAGRRRKLTSEVSDPTGGAVAQYLAAEQQPSLPQRMQRGQPGDRRGCGLSIANGLGQNRHSVAATIDPLGPGARG